MKRCPRWDDPEAGRRHGLKSRGLIRELGQLVAVQACPPPLFGPRRYLECAITVPGDLIDAVLDHAIARERIVGAVMLVARDRDVVYRRALGYADREEQRPMREDALFRLASVTKPIVSVAALALMEQGRLRLDDPVTRWLPDFRPKLPDGREPVITVQHLMTHTAGLAYGFLQPEGGPYQLAGVSDGLDQPGLSMAENLRRIASTPLAYEPGASWGYSVATDVLGAVLAEAAGAPLPELVADLVTRPLDLSDTAFTVRDPARLATPYGDGEPRPIRMAEPHLVPFGVGGVRYSPARAFDSASFPSAGAGMVGGAEDILRFLEALRLGGAPVLERESVKRLTTNTIGDLRVTTSPEGWGFGLGVGVLKDPRPSGTPQTAGTWRWGGAYGHTWFVDPAERLTVVVLTNTALAGMTGAFPDAVRNAVYGVA